ncbi:MAG: efflux RND transporter periplasmic adaptor subunit [Bryobacterales bacterium]|nr:efflux RND transporter periplasmic adaptor subunit [Bryobacterales bacterium]MBV9401421.1 efflux RND transporter periplasmic adaptor subunit [Bryobacterales bacterium]
MKRVAGLNWFLPFLLLAACSNPKAATETPAGKEATSAKDEVVLSPEQLASAQIQTQAIAMSQQPDLLRVKGRIALADDRVWRIGVRTLGSVVAVYAGLGDYVRKGQILARYHADEVRDSRAQYRAALAELERAKSAAGQAQRNLDRARRLLELKAGSAQQVELAQQDLMTAQAAVRKDEIEVDRGRDLLEDDLRVPADPPANRTDETEDDVPIIAPGDGYVIEKNVTPGKTVELSSVTFVIGDLSKVWMLASVRQEDLPKLRAGQSAFITLGGQDGARMAGKITNLGQEFDPVTRVMQVRIELDNPQGRLRPEMLADAEIPAGRAKSVLLAPSDAVQQVNGQDVVFIGIAPGRFAVRPVRVGEAADGKTPIFEGLKAGDSVVIHGSFILKGQLLKASLESE